MIQFKATETTCDKIMPGEMFSSGGPEFWENTDPRAIGQKVYIRTGAPCPPPDVGELIYRIEVEEIADE